MPRTEANNHVEKICPQCHYQRSAMELAPEWQCPRCQIVYAKYSPPEPPHYDIPLAPPLNIDAADALKKNSSPLPWLVLLLGVLLWCGDVCIDYFRWPDNDKITLFTAADDAATCAAARNWLNAQNVAFIEKNIDASDENHNRWKRAGGNQVPLTFFGEERIGGFNATIYQIALTGFKERMNTTINQTVILFSSANCSDCETVVSYLMDKNIEFEEYDIREIENDNVYQELFGRKLPLMFIGNIRLDGYSEKTLKLALKQVDLP